MKGRKLETLIASPKKAENVSSTYKPLQEAYGEYKETFHFSRLLVESRDVEEILQRLIALVGEIVDFNALALLLKEKYSDDFYIRFEYELNNSLAKKIRWLERCGYLDWVCKEGRVSIIPEEKESPEEPSPVLVPLISGKKEIGVLIIFLKLFSYNLTNHLSDLLSLLGTQAAQALENACLYQEMEFKHHAMSNMKTFLENALESMLDGFFAIDLENKISLYNARSGEILGVTAVEAIGSEIHKIFPADFAAFLDHGLQTLFTVGNFEGEIMYQNPTTGKSHPLGIRLSILKDGRCEEIGAIAICQDLSERKELIHLRKLDQLKDEFISSVSHELRTPLTSIKSFTEILLQYQDYDTKTRNEFLGIIEKETNRLIEIVNDLLDLSRMNQEDFQIKYEPLNIQPVLSEALNSLNVLAASKRIQIHTKLNPDYLWIVGDSNRLIQLFMNLVGNAIKFSPENSTVEIWSQAIKGKRAKDKYDFLQIAVSDQGCGIPKEYHKAIFERFKQYSYDPATKPEGSGLGLSICKKIVEKLGGTIWVESEENKGSTFYFTLPLAEKQTREKEICGD